MQTVVYIDAFNLYYGACRAPGRRWLNPLALAQRLLPNDEIVEFAYFTANIKHDPEDRSAALSPDPLPANASFIRLSARDVAECQLPDQIVSPKGARLVKPETW